jgi:hypothetical protein
METAADVKQILLDVSGLEGTIDGLTDDTSLSGLGFNDAMCRVLAQRLNTYVGGISPGTSVDTHDISQDMAVADVVKLITDKLA